MINIFSWAFTCSLVLLCTLDEDFWIQVLGFLLWVFHLVFILGFFPCFVICFLLVSLFTLVTLIFFSSQLDFYSTLWTLTVVPNAMAH